MLDEAEGTQQGMTSSTSWRCGRLFDPAFPLGRVCPAPHRAVVVQAQQEGSGARPFCRYPIVKQSGKAGRSARPCARSLLLRPLPSAAACYRIPAPDRVGAT